MTNFNNSLLFSNIFDPLSHNEETALRTLEKISLMNKYVSIETRPFKDPILRQEFRELAKKSNWSLTFWLTSDMNKNKANLSSVDEKTRVKSLNITKDLIDIAVEGGAEYIGLGAGSISKDISVSFNQFYESLIELLTYMEKYPETYLMIEPLDMYVDKKSTIGDLNTTQNLFKRLEKNGLDDKVYLCIDTAHFILNDDDIFETLSLLGKYSNRLHFANAIIDSNNSNFGDKHLPFGGDGVLDENLAKKIIKFSSNIEFKTKDIYVTAEVRCNDIEKVWILEDECFNFITNAMK